MSVVLQEWVVVPDREQALEWVVPLGSAVERVREQVLADRVPAIRPLVEAS